MLTGVILAGGAGVRFGGADKGMLEVGGQKMVARVIARLKPQVDRLLIVANRNQAEYRAFGPTVISDRGEATQPFAGPLAGFCAALNAVDRGNVLITAVDAIRLPMNLAQALLAAGIPSQVQSMPVCCLLSHTHRAALLNAWQQGQRSPKQWLHSIGATEVAFEDHSHHIWSVNTPEELQAAEALLGAH